MFSSSLPQFKGKASRPLYVSPTCWYTCPAWNYGEVIQTASLNCNEITVCCCTGVAWKPTVCQSNEYFKLTWKRWGPCDRALVAFNPIPTCHLRRQQNLKKKKKTIWRNRYKMSSEKYGTMELLSNVTSRSSKNPMKMTSMYSPWILGASQHSGSRASHFFTWQFKGPRNQSGWCQSSQRTGLELAHITCVIFHWLKEL